MEPMPQEEVEYGAKLIDMLEDTVGNFNRPIVLDQYAASTVLGMIYC